MAIRGAAPKLERARTSLAVAAALALLGCDGREAAGGNGSAGNAALPKPDSNLTSAIPLPDPELDRQRILLAVAEAASAHAAGTDDREAQAALAGRQFTFRLRFGCPGQAPQRPDASMSSSYDEKTQRLKVEAKPDINGDVPLIKAVAAADVEAAEGFWVGRPWLLTPACPAAPVAAAAPPPKEGAAPTPKKDAAPAEPASPPQASAPPTVGLVQFFTASDPRVRRRPGRTFQTVQRLDPASAAASAGYDLLLAGRLKAFSDGKVIKCVSADPASRPVCIVSVEFNAVSIENPGTGSTIAEWGVG